MRFKLLPIFAALLLLCGCGGARTLADVSGCGQWSRVQIIEWYEQGGSAGTHNGMRSIIGETGLTNFPRIRVGIRDEEVKIPIIDYVLSEVRKEDYELFAAACRKAGEAAAYFAKGNPIDRVMNEYN